MFETSRLQPCVHPGKTPAAALRAGRSSIGYTQALPADKVCFSGNGKTKLSAEERAKMQALDEQAPKIRQAMPKTFKLWSPIPLHGKGMVKHGHIQKFLKALQASPLYKDRPELQKSIGKLMDETDAAPLIALEDRLLDYIESLGKKIQSRDTSEIQLLYKFMPPGFLKEAFLKQYTDYWGKDKLGLLSPEEYCPKPPADANGSPPSPNTSEKVAQIALAALAQESDGKKAVYLPAFAQSVNPTLKTAALNMLFGPLADAPKALAIRSIAHGPDFTSKERAIAAIATINNPNRRESLTTELADLKEQSVTHGLSIGSELLSLQALVKADTDLPLSGFLADALKPYGEAGLTLFELPAMLNWIKHTQQDEGNLITELLPGYQQVLDTALKRPDRLVQTGQATPSPEAVRKTIQSKRMGILQAVALIGPAAVKDALCQKHLDDLLDIIPRIEEHPDLIKPLYEVSRFQVSPNDVLKLMEFARSFIKLEKKDRFIQLLTDMAQQKTIDTRLLSKEYMLHTLESTGLKVDEITDDQLDKWNMGFIHTISYMLNHSSTAEVNDLKNLCAATLKGQYRDFIFDPNTEIGQANLKTQNAFQTAFQSDGIVLDYKEWLNFKGQINFERPSKAQILSQTCKSLVKAITALEQHDPQAAQKAKDMIGWGRLLVKDGTLQHASGSAPEYEDLRNLLHRLRYEIETKSPDYTTLVTELYEHLGSALEKAPKAPENLKIKLWDRQPGFDLFLGNYTGACIRLDGGSGYRSVQALLNTFVQVAYLRNEKDQVVGKALFFWARDVKTNQPVLVLNTFEGRGSNGNYEADRLIREQFVEFGRQLSMAVAGRHVPILSATRLNPIYNQDLTKAEYDLEPIGTANNGTYYLDALTDSTQKLNKVFKNQLVYVLWDGKTPPPPAPEAETAPVTAAAPEENTPQPGAQPDGEGPLLVPPCKTPRASVFTTVIKRPYWKARRLIHKIRNYFN